MNSGSLFSTRIFSTIPRLWKIVKGVSSQDFMWLGIGSSRPSVGNKLGLFQFNSQGIILFWLNKNMRDKSQSRILLIQFWDSSQDLG